jgi:hypothetical protein
MITIQVTVEGVTALLCNRATEEALSGGGSRSNTVSEREDPRVIAGRGVYRMPHSNQIALPGAAFGRMVREAGGAHKAKGSRKSIKYVVPAALVILDDLVPLFLRDRKSKVTDFEVDSRPVTIPATKGRVMRHRARLNEWTAVVSCQLNEAIIGEALMRQLWTEGLQQIGIGDYRPEKGGPFGTSSIVAWDVISERRPLSEAQQRNSRRAAA